jgi:hypothetical protein
MTIEITENTRAIWYVTIPNGDWMAHLEARDGGGCKITYRFRYYEGRQVWDGNDRKSWYRFEGDDIEATIAATREAAQKMKELGKGKLWELIRGAGSLEGFMKEFFRLPFVHTKTVAR